MPTNNPKSRSSSLVNETRVDGSEFCPPEQNNITVTLQRAAVSPTDDLALWVVIRKSTEAISFKNYAAFIDNALFGTDDDAAPRQKSLRGKERKADLIQRRRLPLNDSNAYQFLKAATEAFLVVNGGVDTSAEDFDFDDDDARELNLSLGGACYSPEDLEKWWDRYRGMTNGDQNDLLPYLALIQDRLGDYASRRFLKKIGTEIDEDARSRYMNILGRKLRSPFFFELIWSYWQESGMLVQTVSAIARRFQNIRNPREGRDPLADLEIGGLFPLSNLLWGYVQDEPHRLSVARRVYEYDHHYGLTLHGQAVPRLRSADSRSSFIEAFHNLLHLCANFFRQDDDTTVNADAFPLLNALQEVHLILSQGAHNQFGDLPSTARQEMLFQQWMLSQPELGEFLPSRSALAYPEPWMGRVDAMRALQGWGTTSVVNFHNLATFGEQILIGIRYGAWGEVSRPAQAANWARIWRAEIQGYTHAYRSVSGVDLTSSPGAHNGNGVPSRASFGRSGMPMRNLRG